MEDSEYIKIYEGSKDSPDKIENYVVPHVALEGSSDNESNGSCKVGQKEHVTPKFKSTEKSKAIGGEYGDGSKPSNKISEYF